MGHYLKLQIDNLKKCVAALIVSNESQRSVVAACFICTGLIIPFFDTHYPDKRTGHGGQYLFHLWPSLHVILLMVRGTVYAYIKVPPMSLILSLKRQLTVLILLWSFSSS
jgi:hypothetical protein